MQNQLLKAFSQNIIAIDFEFRDDDHPPYKVGVFSPDTGDSQEWDIDKKSEAKVMELIDKICSHRDIILGHNIIAHDLALLQKFYPHLNLLNKPVIDTLLLSPLAFPKWPYHKLIKDYKLVSHSRNKPADDARLSWSLFEDEVRNLSNRDKVPDLIFSAYANWFITADTKGGFQRFYEHLAEERNFTVDPSEELTPVLSQLLKDRACSTNFEKVFTYNAINPLAKAFSLSWIYGADEFSILSRWVRLRYSDVEVILSKLRDEDCDSKDCVYCRSTFDLNSHLKNFFDFDHLRPDQESIVQRMIEGENLLAILPTGGGKSLCYQLPALINGLRRKKLTVVISPLQALMKDQVDNLKAKQIRNAGAVYSGITPQERKEVLDGVESGKIDIIYIAPEQLRNSNFISRIEQREIGTWVIDEAHCVSNWGHDFRPDYLYIPKIIAKLSNENNVPIPQVACFTATAKKDVIDEIQDIFKKRLAGC
jgi:ATP-dependent DNA helicase RecQ